MTTDLADWHGSLDAMRWSPPWGEPVVRSPHGLVEGLVTEGWDGYAAHGYQLYVLRRMSREVVAVGEAVSRFLRWVVEGFAVVHHVAQQLAPRR